MRGLQLIIGEIPFFVEMMAPESLGWSLTSPGTLLKPFIIYLFFKMIFIYRK